MNILMVCPYFYPDIGGTENIAYNIAKGMCEKGHKITVLCSTKIYQSKVETIGQIKVIRQKPDFMISNTPIRFDLCFTIAKLLKEEKFDLVNAYTPVPYYADIAWYESKRQKVPFVLSYMAGSLMKNEMMIDIISRVYQIIEKIMLDNVEKIITLTDFVREKHLVGQGGKVDVIPPGVNTNLFVQSDESRRDGILFVGQINEGHKWKGLNYLLRAMELLPREIKLTVVGDGNLLQIYKKYAIMKKINVVFKGRLQGTKLIHLYQTSKILVLPSYSDAESFGMVLIEAMACGTPVIGSRIGGIPEVIKDNETGLLVEPGNIIAIADAINILITDEKLWNKLSKNGLIEIKKKYLWENIVDKTEQVFKSVMG